MNRCVLFRSCFTFHAAFIKVKVGSYLMCRITKSVLKWGSGVTFTIWTLLSGVFQSRMSIEYGSGNLNEMLVRTSDLENSNLCIVL